MRKVTPCLSLPVMALICFYILPSCNNQAVDIPFPISDSGYAQPATVPLHLSATKKLNWVTIKTGSIKPTLRKFDIDALPSKPYDPIGFKPLSKAPEQIHVDLTALPDSAFDLAKIPSEPLQFKTSVLPPPVITKAGVLVPKNAARLFITDFGQVLGIQGTNILCLIQAKNGMIWIGTNKGIYQYDGEYVQFYAISSPSGIAGMIEDDLHRIWYISDEGIGVIDRGHGLILRSTKITSPFPRLPRMILDHKGRIWLTQVLTKDVDVIDTRTQTYQELNKNIHISGSYTWSVYQDDKKNILLATNQGIDLINLEKGRISYISSHNGLYSDTVRSITGDKKGNIWVTFKNSGLQSIDREHSTMTSFGRLFDFDNIYTYHVIFDRFDRIWMATNHGLVIVDPTKQLIKFPSEEEGVPSDFTLDLLLDQKQRLWVATYQTSLYAIGQDAQLVFPIGKKNMSTLFEDGTGKIWAGTTNEGIVILDGEKKKITEINKQVGFNDNLIQSISQYNGQIWVTSNGGLDIIDQTKKTIEHYGKKEGLLSDTIYSVIKDIKGNIWISGPSEGVEVIDSAKTSIRRINTAGGLSDNTVSNMKMDNEGNIWIATQKGGVDFIDPATWNIQYLTQGPGLRDTCYRVITADKVNRMWIGTDKGIYVADRKGGTLSSINTSNGLSDDYVSSLISYKEDMIAGTHNKVNIITPPAPVSDSSKIAELGKWGISIMANSEGLVMTQLAWDVNIITQKGKYYWGDAGITIVNQIEKERDSATTFITGLNIMNQPLNFSNRVTLNEQDTVWNGDHYFVKDQPQTNTGYNQLPGLRWDTVSGPYHMPENLQVPYDLNYMQFQFSQGNIGRHEATVFSYILLGIDKQWSRFDTKTVTDNYLSLPPGNYIFKVRSRSVNGQWTQPAVLSFTITPPWWKTWWAYALYVITLASIFWGFIHYRSKQLLRENRVLEDKVEARTKEVKQQADELATVNQISQALVSQADLNDLITLVGNQLRDLFKADIVYIALLDNKTKIISFPYQYGDQMPPLKLGEGLTSKIILSGQPLLINKDVHEHTSSLGIGRVGIPAACYLGVPIPVSDEIIGVLSIQSTEKENRFAEKDKRLLTTIAANVGVAIRKARLFEEVKKANTEADFARKNAEEANAAKSAFLSTVSHELRTPLTSVLGFAKITKKRLEEKIFPLTDTSDPKTIKTIEQISGNLGVVISEGERLTNLINDVLDLAKIEAGKMEWNLEPVQIPDIVERAIAATSSLFDQKNLKLERKVDPDLPEISGDRDKLIQVVVNLLSNAVKFTKEGIVTCSVALRDGNIVVGITDTGIGIAPEDHAKVFEQFKQVGDTLTDKPKGTGLGLPICKEIVEHHHGKIWLESDLGKGSTFYFSLPVIPKDEQAVRHIQLNDLVRQLKRRMEQSHPAIGDHVATILVVDDDEGIRSLLKQELTEAGYTVDEAANGKEAITRIRAKRPDLVILDVMMPEMNGFDVAAIMKNDPQTMDIPIIILSVVQDKSRGFRIGVDRYLTKPIDTALLFSEIGHLLEQGKSRKKVMVVDEDNVTVRTLTDVLEAKGYQVVESDGKELVEKAIANQPDIIILNSLISDKHEIVSTLRFEKGLENVLFLIYQ